MAKQDGQSRGEPSLASRPDGFDALPRRFKQYADCLEQEIAALRDASPIKQETRVRIVNHSARHAGRDEQYLPDKTRIAFRVDDEWIECSIQESAVGDVIQVSGEWNGLSVYLHMSNIVFVKAARKGR